MEPQGIYTQALRS